ncbi:helix-turn-helix domain-containing protein [Candidatus Poriferisodalis sp.]|uniref:helix-turn-helix domain-containing protein n=1 Tax=Candidatus Poriferisodalis sp. TaxID=3101277 RepID=UPI003B0291CE
MTNRPQLGTVLQRVRQARDLAQIDLAAAAGVQRSTISAIENSQRSVNMETLMRLLDVLGVEFCVRDRIDHESNISADAVAASHLEFDHDA